MSWRIWSTGAVWDDDQLLRDDDQLLRDWQLLTVNDG